MMAATCWLLIAGRWLLVADGCGLLRAVGCWLVAAGCGLLACGCWLLVAVAVGCMVFVAAESCLLAVDDLQLTGQLAVVN